MTLLDTLRLAGAVPFAARAEATRPPEGDGKFYAREVMEPLGGAVVQARQPWPWRGLVVAGSLHLVAVALVVLVIKARDLVPPPDGPAISVAVETMPQGDTTSDVKPEQVPPVPAAAAQLVQPVAKPDLRLKPVSPRTAPPAFARAKTHPPSLVRGSHVAGGKLGSRMVGATRPARPDAGSTVYYNEISRQLGQVGEVQLRIVVSPTGAPRQVMMEKSSGYPRLDDDALASARTWHFQPALRHGVKVESVLSYWIRFQLH